MYFPDANSINLYSNLNEQELLSTPILRNLIERSHILEGFEDTKKELFLKYDLISCFFVDTNLKELSILNFKISAIQSILDKLEEISTYYYSAKFSVLDIQLGILNIVRFLKKKEDLDSNQLLGLDSILDQISDVDKIDFFQKLYNLLLVEPNLQLFINEIRLISNILKDGVNVEFLNRYYYLWLLYKAYINAPELVFSFIDDLAIVGYIQEPKKESIYNQLQELNLTKEDFENEQIVEDYFKIILSNYNNYSRIVEVNRTISQIYPSILESIYNLSQLARIVEEEDVSSELYLDGEKVTIDYSVLESIEDFFLILDIIEQLYDMPFEYEYLEELLNFILDMVIELETEVGNDIEEEATRDILLKILSRIFVDLTLVYERFNLSIFERVDGLSIFEYIYKLDELFVLIFRTFSGNLSGIANNSGIDSKLIANSIKNSRLLKINILNKFIDNPKYPHYLICKRIEFFQSIKNRSIQFQYINTDIIDRLENRLKNFEIKLERSNFLKNETATETILSISKRFIPLYFNLMAESLDNVSEKIESVRLIVSILIKMGLEINLNEDNTLNLEVNSNTIDNFIKGYSNTLVLDGEFTLGNLTAFSLQGF